MVLLAGALLQAWSDRHGITPDGVSYLDLSDAVVDGSWRGLVNAYWSPLYPLLLGLARRAQKLFHSRRRTGNSRSCTR